VRRLPALRLLTYAVAVCRRRRRRREQRGAAGTKTDERAGKRVGSAALRQERQVVRPERYLRDNFVYARTLLNDADVAQQRQQWLDDIPYVWVHAATRERPGDSLRLGEHGPVFRPCGLGRAGSITCNELANSQTDGLNSGSEQRRGSGGTPPSDSRSTQTDPDPLLTAVIDSRR
jgi:hypothetical protein